METVLKDKAVEESLQLLLTEDKKIGRDEVTPRLVKDLTEWMGDDAEMLKGMGEDVLQQCVACYHNKTGDSADVIGTIISGTSFVASLGKAATYTEKVAGKAKSLLIGYGEKLKKKEDDKKEEEKPKYDSKKLKTDIKAAVVQLTKEGMTNHISGQIGSKVVGWGVSKFSKMFADARTESLQKMKELYTPKPAANDNHQPAVGSNQGALGGDSLNAYGLEKLESEYGHLSALGKLDTAKQKGLVLTGKACSKLLSECAEDGVKISLATWRYISEGSAEDKSIHLMGTTYVRERGGKITEIRTDTLQQGRGVIGDTVANAMNRYEGSTLKNVVVEVNRLTGQGLDIVAGNTVGGKLMNAVGELAGEGAQQVGHIFRNKEGHILKPSEEAERLLLEVCRNARNYLGKDRIGNSRYGTKEPDGSQIWVSVWQGTIQNGGINAKPLPFNFLTGLKAIGKKGGGKSGLKAIGKKGGGK